MANQDNFPDKLIEVPNFRPRRVSKKDRTLVQDQDSQGQPLEKEVVFGQTLSDVIELYITDDLGNIIAHTNLRPNDPAVRLIAFTPDQQVGVGQDETPDVLQIDLVQVLKRLGPIDIVTGEPEGLPPGRYAIAVNIFRDEIGQEAGGIDRKLFISDISPKRTELRLRPAFSNDKMVNEINEFIEPSVPRFVAQAIIDQAFGISLDFLTDEAGISVESINFKRFEEEIARLDEANNRTEELTTANRLRRAGLGAEFYAVYDTSIPLSRDRILDALAKQFSDLQVQDYELQKFIRDGVGRALIELVNNGAVDPRLQLINRDGVPITPTSTRLRTE